MTPKCDREKMPVNLRVLLRVYIGITWGLCGLYNPYNVGVCLNQVQNYRSQVAGGAPY